jgi:hypothetical protein
MRIIDRGICCTTNIVSVHIIVLGFWCGFMCSRLPCCWGGRFGTITATNTTRDDWSVVE